MKLAFIVAILIVGCAISAAVNFYRRLKVKGVAQELGLEFLPKVEIKGELDGCDLFMNSGYAHKFINCFGGQADEIEFKIFEYRYTIGSGKRQKVHSQTVTFIQLPHLELPDFQVKSKGFFGKWFGQPLNTFDVDDAAFANRYWTCGTKSVPARGMFTDEVKALIQSRGWSVEVSRGRLLVYRPGKTVRHAQLKDFLTDSLQFMAHLESALENPAIPAYLLGTPGQPIEEPAYS